MQRGGEVGVCCYVIDAEGLVLGRGGKEGEVEVGVGGAERAGVCVGVGGGGHGLTGELVTRWGVCVDRLYAGEVWMGHSGRVWSTLSC